MKTNKTYTVEVHLDCGLIVSEYVDAFVANNVDLDNETPQAADDRLQFELQSAAIDAALKVSDDYSQVVDYARVVVGDNTTLYETTFDPACFDCYDDEFELN